LMGSDTTGVAVCNQVQQELQMGLSAASCCARRCVWRHRSSDRR
jgi:hypothetical protein